LEGSASTGRLKSGPKVKCEGGGQLLQIEISFGVEVNFHELDFIMNEYMFIIRLEGTSVADGCLEVTVVVLVEEREVDKILFLQQGWEIIIQYGASHEGLLQEKAKYVLMIPFQRGLN